jgi:predicted metal-dependent peptidase
MEEQNRALSKAKIALMKSPDTMFYAVIAYSLIHEFDEGIPTACTNGTRVRYNPEFFMSLSPNERVFLITHETMHVAYMHMDRLNTRDTRIWNMAADYVINLQLVNVGMHMPKNGLLNVAYADMSTEQVYDLLLKNAEHIKLPMMDLEPSDNPDLVKQVDDILIQAAIKAKQAGAKPGAIPKDFEVYLEKLLNPTLPWNRILAKYVNALAKTDYSYKKPNRRHLPNYLPSLQGESLGELVVAIDASGSVSDTDFASYITEIHSLFKSVKPSKITIIGFDTKIRHKTTVTSLFDIANLKFKARGGTSIVEVIDYINKAKSAIRLIFTDGEFHWEDTYSKLPLIWLINNNKSFMPKYGKAIHFTT